MLRENKINALVKNKWKFKELQLHLVIQWSKEERILLILDRYANVIPTYKL